MEFWILNMIIGVYFGCEFFLERENFCGLGRFLGVFFIGNFLGEGRSEVYCNFYFKVDF